MTILKLKYIITVVECGSIQKASERLYVSQPCLTNAIHEVENEISQKIFLRTNKGVTLTSEGVEFLGYARQVIEQMDVFEHRYMLKKQIKSHFSVSTQHYAFVVKAFVDFLKKQVNDEFEFTLRETRTYEIIEDVKNLKSEVGVLYINEFNEKILNRQFKQYGLEFHTLFSAKPHIFVSSNNPLARKDIVTINELENYPCLSFEQGDYNSFYYSEEILSLIPHKKKIWVSDRATIFNLMIGLNGYTISTGVISSELNGENIVAVPLDVNENITIGWIAHKTQVLSKLAQSFIDEMKLIVSTL